MSDVAQGPGWWMASDGRFYPPQLHPSALTSRSDAVSAVATLTDEQPQSVQRGLPNYPTSYAVGPPPYVDQSSLLDPVLRLALAPWWKRLVAILIDGVLIGISYYVIVVVITIATHPAAHKVAHAKPVHPGAVFAGFILIVVLAAIPASIYYAIMNGSRRGQTVGKLAIGIAVRDGRNGGSIGFWRALGRFFITVIFEVALYVPFLLDSLAPLWDKRRQAWHDKVAHSVVVDLRP